MLTNTVAGITSKKGFAISKPSDLLKILQSAGEYSEQPTRIAVFEQEFVKGLKKGLSQEEAATRAAGTAQDATVNFARRGAKTQSVNAIYAFLNARAQGVDRLVRTLRNDPVGGAFRIGLITQVRPLLVTLGIDSLTLIMTTGWFRQRTREPILLLCFQTHQFLNWVVHSLSKYPKGILGSWPIRQRSS